MAVNLNEGIGELHSVIELAGDYLDTDVVARARSVLDRARERRAVGQDMTIVALAGSTGAGKSSLVNALVGEEVARVAPTRPTTSMPKAIVNVADAQTLDWLGVNERHVMPDLAARLGGEGAVMLLDLPDIDSTNASHRAIAARLIELVDVVVWVLDPQKYADAVIHEDYFARLGEHADVMLTVLNQADRLRADELDGVVDNLRSILDSHGVQTDVLPTSAVTGAGLSELRARIMEIVERKSAASQRLAADVRTVGRELAGVSHAEGGRDPQTVTLPNSDELARVIARAAGAEVVARAAGESYRLRGAKATGWPVTRWLRGAKIDPLKRLHLTGESAVAPVTGVATNESARTQTRVTARSFLEAATQHMPRAWARDVREDATQRVEGLLHRADGVIAETDLEARRRPLWWTVVNAFQWLALVTAVVGGVWLALMFAGDTLQLRLPEPPYLWIVPLPTILLVGGILVGWLLSVISRIALGRGQRRTHQRVISRLTEAIERAMQTDVVEPLTARLSDYARFYDSTRRLAVVCA